MAKCRFKDNEWRRITKARMIESMGGKCQGCGYNKYNGAMDFHHIDPLEKDYHFAGVRASRRKWVTICDELEKCVLVCSNCHREIHAGVLDVHNGMASFEQKYRDYTFFLTFRPDREAHNCPVCKGKKRKRQKTCSNPCFRVLDRRTKVLKLHEMGIPVKDIALKRKISTRVVNRIIRSAS